MPGKLVIFSAPSGSGKTTIVRHLLQKGLSLEFSVSACNRSPRGIEVHGKDYYFLTTSEFQQRIAENAFVEWEEVYQGRYYGTLRTEIDRIWQKGNHVLFDVDVQGGLNIKKQFGQRAFAVFVKPPSIEVLKERLEKRNTDSVEDIQNRLAKAEEEISFASKFDYILVNRNLDQTKQEAEQRVRNFLNND